MTFSARKDCFVAALLAMTKRAPSPAEGAVQAVNPQSEIRNPKLKRRWYSVSMKNLLIILLAVLLLISFNVSPVWRLLWYWPILSRVNFVKVKAPDGQKLQAWRWIEGRRIRVQYLDPRHARGAEQVANGVRELLHDTGVDLNVEVMPAPAEVVQAYQDSLTPAKPGSRDRYVSFFGLSARLAALRKNDPHADIVIIPDAIKETNWAFGMAAFHCGTSLIRSEHADAATGKHESCHLIGYMMHDSLPLFVLGYPWEGWPWNRQTLMMLYSNDTTLSPRARDAVRSFWRKLEKRTKQHYLSPE